METTEFDVVVVGAGFAGLYLLKRLRDAGFTATAVETADDVGGTWYWNRYPGARCDIQSVDYSYSWDSELQDNWKWSEKYSPQPEILRYLQHVADKHDLRRDIQFSTKVESAKWHDDTARWHVQTAAGNTLICRSYVMATGCLSVPKDIDIPGTGRFAGPTYLTGRWPHEGVDFTGMRVAVIGTGSSAIQSIPIIAKQSTALTVLQRTPNFSIPAHNSSVPIEKLARFRNDPAAYREEGRWSGAGVPVELPVTGALLVSDDERLAAYEKAWEIGGIIEFLNCYNDHLGNAEANELLCEFVRNKIRSVVNDPETAEKLCPKDFPIGAKRLCVDTNYFATFNEPHVRLIDIRETPIATITETGVTVGGETIEVDAIVFATGFDAMTGAIVGVDIEGRNGVTLKEKWVHGPVTYLGLMTHDFPNLFMVTGPGSPSVLCNMVVAIEQHVEWITDCLESQRAQGFDRIEPTVTAEQGWGKHVNEFAGLTLMQQTNSWYMGANVPGKPRVFLPYPGGVGRYRTACNEVIDNNYLGLERSDVARTRVELNDGVVRELQPDVQVMLEMMAEMGLPPIESLSAADARLFFAAADAMRPPGPDVGEIVDGMYPCAAGELEYRLYRPATPGPHPIVLYFHGGGWVLGSAISDDPLCRDLCAQSGAIVISANYRHAPEARFPAAVEDGWAALNWAADNAAELGGIPGQLAVAGWSAGGNIAAVTTQLARDAGGPAIVGQVLLTPATDSDLTRESYVVNGDGKILTTGLMKWFWDYYADEVERNDPRASPIKAESLAGLPPATIVTCEFDPLRDEGNAYAVALAAAGVSVQHVMAEGQIHTSIPAVDVLPTGAQYRALMAAAIRSLFA